MNLACLRGARAFPRTVQSWGWHKRSALLLYNTATILPLTISYRAPTAKCN